MAIFNFIKTPNIRRYHHEYIYYDPKKEEREKRIERIRQKKEAKERGLLYADNIRSTFSAQREEREKKRKGNNIHYIVTAIVIAALIYWIK
ncbi:MAG: hypothetical protein J6U08_04825 [Paludibacteraceae bacterium]|nr:hypothetical protein [Paludibacteraceae bacterium]MBR3520141.1 hypothetical protein [Paludibacteraceae bacterium]